MPKAHLPKCFDPYLRYAISTGFANFKFPDDRKLSLFVELKPNEQVAKFEDAMTDPKVAGKFGAEFGPDVGRTRYATLLANKAAVLDDEAFRIWNQFVSRVELSLPVKPSVSVKFAKRKRLVDRFKLGKDPVGPLLIGMLDDGCPFAATRFLKTLANGALSTRVRGIWDQNQGKLAAQIGGRSFGQTPTDFGFGLEYQRDFAPSIGPPPIGIDEWIALHSTPTNGIDEDSCYADAGFETLSRRDSHGAHVMDVLAGRIPTSSRIGPFPPGDRRDPPSWKPGTDPASSADIVFVQFSQDCIDDSTGVWLKTFVVQGIQYILSFADPVKTKKVVINLSYGPTTGPHDGTAPLELLLAAFVAQYNGTPGNPKLEIALAAGNAYLSEGHVVFTGDTRHDHAEWIWFLPPDNSVLCFSEVWMRTADVGATTIVTLTSPSGKIYTPTPPSIPPPFPLPPAGVDDPIVWGNDTMWRLVVEPTMIQKSYAAAEHGNWKIKISGVRPKAEVHAFVARSDPNMGVVSGARLSLFIDPEWERTRAAAASCTYVDGEFDKIGSLVRRDGTLNGIATGDDPSVHVAGGHIVLNGRKAPYSSAGPARAGAPRTGPDFVMPGDETCALQGIRAGSNRSGAVFRLIGTSTAAPQLAREVANPPLPTPTDIPSSPEEVAKRGGGDLEPP
jgi:hypothetical protein